MRRLAQHNAQKLRKFTHCFLTKGDFSMACPRMLSYPLIGPVFASDPIFECVFVSNKKNDESSQGKWSKNRYPDIYIINLHLLEGNHSWIFFSVEGFPSWVPFFGWWFNTLVLGNYHGHPTPAPTKNWLRWEELSHVASGNDWMVWPGHDLGSLISPHPHVRPFIRMSRGFQFMGSPKSSSHGFPWLSIETHGDLGIPH